MASILDSGLASIFTSIFIFLLVYAIVYGFLSWRQMFGPNGRGINMIIGFVIGLLAAIAPPAKNFITFVAPWYVALFMTLFFILFIVSMFGLSPDKDFPSIIKDPRVYSWILILSVIIFIIGLGVTFGQGLLAPGSSQPTAEQIISDPNMKVIGNGQYAEPGKLAPGPVVGQPAGGLQAGQPGSTATGDFGTNLVNTIFHPKVLGLIVTLIIAALAVFFLSGPVSGAK